MKVWIIEMLCDGKWEPTVGCALTREDARIKKKGWDRVNPSDKFRVVKYINLGHDREGK